MVNYMMSKMEWWDIGRAGDEIKQKIAKEAKCMNAFCVFNSGLLLSVAIAQLPTDEEKIFSVQQLFSYQNKMLVVALKSSRIVLTSTMCAHVYQMIYATQSFSFQVRLFNKTLAKLAREDEDLEMVSNQHEIEATLKLIIQRHVDFKRWISALLNLIHVLIVLFTLSAILIGVSVLFSFLQDTIPVTSYMMAISEILCVTSLIYASQLLETESEKTFFKLFVPKWYTWNHRNKKLLLVVLINCVEPLKIKFSEHFTVNYRLLLWILQVLFSALSVLRSLQ